MARVARSHPDPRKIDTQGRIHVPPEVMRALGVKKGDFIGFDIVGADIRLRRVKWSME